MKRWIGPLAIFSLAGMTASCGKKPDEVTTFKTPIPGITLTYEYWNAGPLVSDPVRLIAHYTENGKEETREILGGDYVVIAKYLWPSSTRLVLCYKSGVITSFTNEVDFRIGQPGHRFHVTLKDDCPGVQVDYRGW